jgi:methylated-DNA-protein-cysteine methyltransferase-like protein
MSDTKLIKPHYNQIWQTVQLIPIGNVACYGQIADLAGLPGRARLVGKALSKIPKTGWQGKLVPWHRVINSQGKITFPINSIWFLNQIELLQDEDIVVISGKIKLKDFQWQPDLTELLFSLKF